MREENNNPQPVSHSFLTDLLDDLTREELTNMLNYFAISSIPVSRASIKYFRKWNLQKKDD